MLFAEALPLPPRGRRDGRRFRVWGPATGSVEFFDTFRGKRRLVGIATVSGGVARLRMVLRRGMHALQAVYLGDPGYSGSISAVRLRRVVQD